MAARLRHDLGCDVSLESGHYGEFSVLVDGEVVIAGGPMTMLAVLPPYGRVLAVVSAKLGSR